jgi:hypothetical protein
MKASTRIMDEAPASEVHSGTFAQVSVIQCLASTGSSWTEPSAMWSCGKFFDAPPLERVRWRSRSVHASGITQRRSIAGIIRNGDNFGSAFLRVVGEEKIVVKHFCERSSFIVQ